MKPWLLQAIRGGAGYAVGFVTFGLVFGSIIGVAAHGPWWAVALLLAGLWGFVGVCNYFISRESQASLDQEEHSS